MPATTPGNAGTVYSKCSTKSQLAITVAVGMNIKRAHMIVSMIQAYAVELPVTLFVYGDFVEIFPDVVKSWATRFDVQMREDGPYPLGQFSMLQINWARESLVSAELRLQEIGIQPSYYMPGNKPSKATTDVAQSRGLRLVNPNTKFPSTSGKCAVIHVCYGIV